MDFHRTKYRFWPVNYLASRTKDARTIYSNCELKNSSIFNDTSITLFSLWFTFTKITPAKRFLFTFRMHVWVQQRIK